jgi:hypothetical protein
MKKICLLTLVSLSTFAMTPPQYKPRSRSNSATRSHSRRPSADKLQFVGSEGITIYVDRNHGNEPSISTIYRAPSPRPSSSRPQEQEGSPASTFSTASAEDLSERAQYLYGMKYKKPLSAQLMPFLTKRIAEEQRCPTGDAPFFLTALERIEESSRSNSPRSVEELTEWINELVISSIDEFMISERDKMSQAETSLKEKEKELEMSYKKAKLAAISNIGTAFVTAMITVMGMQMSNKEEK